MSAFFAVVHHLAAFAFVAAVAVEFVLVMVEFTPTVLKRLAVADLTVGISAAVLVLTGLLLVFVFETEAAEYFGNGFFLLKLAAFIAVALISVLPTREFLAWRRELSEGRIAAPGRLRRLRLKRLLRLELAGIVVILVCTALIANGVGRF